MKLEPAGTLKPLKTFSLKISEPSGVALNNGKLWIVSDRKNTIYQTDLEGNEISTIKMKIADMEGITFVDNSLAIVKEVPREIILIDLEGNEISRTSLQIDGSKNSGLEGITYNPVNEHFYILNEKDPVLLIETDKNLKEISRKKINNVKDLSGISYSRKENCLWLLSDEDRKIIKASLQGEFIAEYKIDVNQAEGIAIDDENNLIYVVSDKEEKLYIFENK
ncbi:MAG TPA: SdiA-regulated domain-containing protein [Ignavibacteriaceae bacterium]|nr:SdiA-regulated domain-containing protein [Ignavibacteriaceae bacterium]